MIELVLAFLAGVLTVASPCILPILPVIFGTSIAHASRMRPVFIAAGFVLTFSLAALVLGALTDTLGLSSDSLHAAAVVSLFVFGCVMVVPSLFERVNLRLGGLVNRANNIGSRAGPGSLGGLVLGMTLGIVWTPCAGPVLGSILTLVATSQLPAKGATLLVTYAVGASIPMMMIAYGGQYVVGHVRGLARYTQQIQQGFGVVVILVSAALYLQYDVLINVWLLDLAPSLTIGI